MSPFSRRSQAAASGQSTSQYPAYPSYPTVTWESLYQTGDTVQQTLARVGTLGTIVQLPDGFDGVIDNDPMVNNILLYFPNIRGFIGAGSSKSRFRVKKNQYNIHFTVMRLMDGRDGQNINVGWHLAGSDQQAVVSDQANTSHPSIESGYILYNGRNAIFQDFKTSGFQGDWNSPPGETFELNLFKDVGTKIYGYESDGYNLDGELVGGSPLGLNNSTNVEVYDSYLHDSYVSGPTASFAGTWDMASSSSGWKTYNCHFHRNSNWNNSTINGYDYGTGGKRFGGINHENVYGTIVHDHVDIILNNPTMWWDANHVSLNHHNIDNPDIHLIEPTWNTLQPRFNGAFVVSMPDTYGGYPNMQVTPPEVVKNGVTMQPYFQNGSPSATLPINPAKQYVILGTDRR